MSKIIKAVPLTAENFKEFGFVIQKQDRNPDLQSEYCKWWGYQGSLNVTGEISAAFMDIKEREMVMSDMEYHNDSEELISLLGDGELIIPVAPAGKLDEKKIKAFIIDAKKAIIFNKGVKHSLPFPIDRDVNIMVLFKKSTVINDICIDKLSETITFLK